MEYNSQELFNDMSVFNDRMDGISRDNNEEILHSCEDVEAYLYQNGLICRRYQVYQPDWEQFNKVQFRDTASKTLYELFVYLYIYSREEHFCGGYGSFYGPTRWRS